MSKSHDFYTTQIVRYIEKFYYTSGIDIADDTQEVKTGCRPYQINAIIDAEPRSCLPDLTAKDISTEPNLYIVGEAKTAEDFIKRDSQADNQMNVMINYLKNKPRPVLIYSLPQNYRERVINVLENKIATYNAMNIKVEVIDQFFK
jgi:hypothetical protein